MAVEYHTQNGLRAYKAYIALKQHFTKPDYDYFKYNGSTNASFDSYKKRKDAIFFEMLGKQADVVNFIAINLGTYSKVFPKDLATNPKYKQNYEKIRKELESITYVLGNKLRDLGFTGYGDIARFSTVPDNGGHPELVKSFLKGEISLVILCAFDRQFLLTELYDKRIQDPVVWPKLSLQIQKIQPFLNLDRTLVTKAVTKLIAKLMIEAQPLSKNLLEHLDT